MWLNMTKLEGMVPYGRLLLAGDLWPDPTPSPQVTVGGAQVSVKNANKSFV